MKFIYIFLIFTAVNHNIIGQVALFEKTIKVIAKDTGYVHLYPDFEKGSRFIPYQKDQIIEVSGERNKIWYYCKTNGYILKSKFSIITNEQFDKIIEEKNNKVKEATVKRHQNSMANISYFDKPRKAFARHNGYFAIYTDKNDELSEIKYKEGEVIDVLGEKDDRYFCSNGFFISKMNFSLITEEQFIYLTNKKEEERKRIEISKKMDEEEKNEIERKNALKKAFEEDNYNSIKQLLQEKDIYNLDFKSFYTIAKQEKTLKNGETLYSKLSYWSDYEKFLTLYPSYTAKLENSAYSNLQDRALEKRWCSYCCEVYLKLFRNNTERRADVTEWRRFAYNFELSEQNAKTAADNVKALSEANERKRDNEPKMCSVCGGRGVCLECNGKGYKACDYHDSNGDGHCTTCDDRGILNCRKCDNKGTCYYCKGKGKIF